MRIHLPRLLAKTGSLTLFWLSGSNIYSWKHFTCVLWLWLKYASSLTLLDEIVGWCYQVRGESTVGLPNVKSCCCCATGALEDWSPGQPVLVSLCFRSQRPSCLCWVRFVWRDLISFLLSLDFWISDEHWQGSTLTLSFYSFLRISF